MRYLKIFFVILGFFFSMMFFLQNQTVLSSLIVLNMDMIFLGPMLTEPIPLYSIILIAFTAGAILVLLIFIWERLNLSRQLSSSKKKVHCTFRMLQLI